MATRISRSRARSRRIMLRGFLRWLLYAAVLLLFYMLECCSMIRGFIPLLIIPLATAIAMREGELAAGIFGAVCGLMLDMASGTITGFSALWLLMCCPFISLLSRFWIRVNIFSHLILNAAVCVLMGFLDFVFLHWVWEGAQSSISFVHTILPGYGGAMLLAAPVYLLVYVIWSRLRPREERRLEDSVQSAQNADE